ncbi:hypothetical protein P691DRAFT_688758, partial [Macrolepiota fuliginosa MF-IS2]
LISPVAAGKALQAFALWGLYPHTPQLPVDIITQPASEFMTSSLSPASNDISLGDIFVLLVNGTYNLLSVSTQQYFDVPPSIQSCLLNPIHVVVLEILDNWGSNTTCFYSVGVHAESF